MTNRGFRSKKSEVRSGFTLIEVLIASTIIAFAAGSVMVIGRSAIRAYDVGFERTQAYLLAQEGLEIVRSIRDNQSLDNQSNNWVNILPNPSLTTVYRPVWNAATGRWQLQLGNESIQPNSLTNLRFTRSIKFNSPPTLPALIGPDGTALDQGIENNVRRVTIEVTWDQSGTPASVTSSSLLTNWQPED
jgi:prepilin-type N-terminal cleavage/methylation domain-containing protein